MNDDEITLACPKITNVSIPSLDDTAGPIDKNDLPCQTVYQPHAVAVDFNRGPALLTL